MAELLQLSYAMHGPLAETLPQQSGVDYRFHWSASPTIALTEADEQVYRRAAAEMDGGRWLDESELRGLCPLIDQPVRGAYLGAPTGQIDSYLYTQALVAAAQRGGATLRGARVEGLERAGDRVVGVRLAGGEVLGCDVAVVAMGPWSVEAGDWLGAAVAVTPLKGQILRLHPKTPVPFVGFNAADGDYMMPKRSGLVYTGTTEESVGFDQAPTRAARDAIRRFGAKYSSQLGEMEIVQQTACLRPLSQDELPILGAAPSLDGAYLATGHGRKGIMLSPATGLAMAELITQGRSESLDLGPFDPGRFGT
jgi:glycine oxidase